MVNLKLFKYNRDYKYLPSILPLENESRYDPTLTEDEEMPLIPKIVYEIERVRILKTDIR